MMAAVLGLSVGRRSAFRFTAGPPFLHPAQVVQPQLILTFAEGVQVIPRIDPRVMAIGEGGFHGVVTHRLYRHYFDILLARLQHLLSGAVPPDVRRRGIDAQQLVRQVESLAVGENYLHQARFLVKFDLRGDGGVLVQTSHGCDPLTASRPHIIHEPVRERI